MQNVIVMAVKEGELLEQQILRGGECTHNCVWYSMSREGQTKVLRCALFPVGLVMVLFKLKRFTTATGPESKGQGSECKYR